MLQTVYIQAANTSRVTSKPEKGFYDLCLEVGKKCLEQIDPKKIDSFYLASMDPSLFGLKGEFQAELAEELGLQPREMLAIRGTSSAGGVGCIPAYKDVASGYHQYSLVISCEQMNRPTSMPEPSCDTMAREKTAVQEMLKAVIDHDEQLYGLSMILIGDMIERALLRYVGLSRAGFLEVIPKVTMAMCQRAALYPYAHFYGKNKTIVDYQNSPWVSNFYRRDDIVPISTGACAMVLSSVVPPPEIAGRVVELRGVGQGLVHPAIAKRFGPVTSATSVRRALCELLERTGLSLTDLRSADLAFPHDAFPSISRLILKEVGFSHDESIHGLVSGRFNPCGGLVKCGHPVGCSGEMQVVQAFQQMTHDRAAIPEDLQRSPANTAFTVSVGAALTNVIAIYLCAVDQLDSETFSLSLTPPSG